MNSIGRTAARDLETTTVGLIQQRFAMATGRVGTQIRDRLAASGFSAIHPTVMDPEEFRRRFPNGDWFPVRHWEESTLYRRAPTIVEEAMRALSELVPAERFSDLVLGNDQYHPLRLGLVDAGSMSFWPAFKVGFDLCALAVIPESLRKRLLDPAEVRGAESELSAAASLARTALRFDWFPSEGGEFAIEGDVIRYVEVKRPQSESGRTRRELNGLFEITRRLVDTFPRLTKSFALRADLADHLTNKERSEISWTQVADELIRAGYEVVAADELPGRRDTAVGTIWLANCDEEMRGMRAGGASGLFLNGDYEADRVIRGAVNRAVRQLPSHSLSLISIDWSAPPTEFVGALTRRLARLQDNVRVAGVVIRERMFTSADVVPRFTARFIENPRYRGVAEASRVRRALETDDVHELRQRQPR